MLWRQFVTSRVTKITNMTIQAHASQKQKSCKAKAQADTQMQHICFCRDAQQPLYKFTTIF
jgi:hypothetical protein